MKQVLLRETGIWAEMGGGETVQPRQVDFSPGKVKLPQRFGDPDIHRKSFLAPERKQQRAIRDFPADPRQFQ